MMQSCVDGNGVFGVEMSVPVLCAVMCQSASNGGTTVICTIREGCCSHVAMECNGLPHSFWLFGWQNRLKYFKETV